MAADHIVAVRVSAETKARLRALAGELDVPESTLVRNAVERLVEGRVDLDADFAASRVVERSALARVAVRVRPHDRELLASRANARGLAPATYVAALLRAHLRGLAPLPKDEFLTLKRLSAELGACGRNLNQIARALHRGEPAAPDSSEVATQIGRLCIGVRNHLRTALAANLKSWESGDGRSR